MITDATVPQNLVWEAGWHVMGFVVTDMTDDARLAANREGQAMVVHKLPQHLGQQEWEPQLSGWKGNASTHYIAPR